VGNHAAAVLGKERIPSGVGRRLRHHGIGRDVSCRQPARAIGAITDVSERRQLEEQLRQAPKPLLVRLRNYYQRRAIADKILVLVPRVQSGAAGAV